MSEARLSEARLAEAGLAEARLAEACLAEARLNAFETERLDHALSTYLLVAVVERMVSNIILYNEYYMKTITFDKSRRK